MSKNNKKDKNKVVSAYSKEGQELNKKNELTKGFKIFILLLYILGFVGALALIVVLTRSCS